MRIGLFTDTYLPDINGVVSSVVTLQTELEKHGHEVFVIANHKALTSKWDGNVLRLPGLELKWLYGYKLSTPFHQSAKEEIRKLKLDIIHVHTEFGVGMFGRIVAKYLNIPVVSTYHTMYEDYTHYLIPFENEEVDRVGRRIVGSVSRVFAENVQAMIAPSEKTKETLLKYGVTTPIYIIPTGLSFEKFNVENIDAERVCQIRQSYGIKEDEKLVVYVGRIAQEKSIEIPIEGFRYVKNPKIKMMIVGGGPQLEELKELARSYRLQERIIFTDKVENDEVPYYYACADCFVSASLTETQGMTFIEALACGLPVFARPDEVLEDLVFENESGFLFDTGKEFAQKLEDYMGRAKEEQERLHIRAKECVKKYDADVFYSKVLSVYFQVLDDFQDAYEVTKVKMLDDYVRIYVMNDKEDEPKKLMIDLEDYFLYKIRLHTMLDRHTVQEFEQKEAYLNAYRNAIRRLRMRDYTRKEMEQVLAKLPGMSDASVQKMLNELEQKGYINDTLYMANKIEKMQYSLSGKGRIRKTLINKGIPKEAVDEALADFKDEEEREKALKMAEKLRESLKGKSAAMKTQAIIRKLISYGFDNDIAKATAGILNFEAEDDREALEKTIQKAIRGNQRKYQGKELKERVYAYCMRKGFASSEIRAILEEMEWEELHEN